MKTWSCQIFCKSAMGCMLAFQLLRPAGLSAGTLITFQVDMTAQAQIGRFNLDTGRVAVATSPMWGFVFQLTNQPAGPNPYLFSGTRLDTNNSPGTMVSYVFGYEFPSPLYHQRESPLSTCGSNRTVVLPATNGAHLVLPVVYFDDLPPGVPLVTNDIIFQVDMSRERSVFGPDTRDGGYLWVHCIGSFNGWNSLHLTNNPSVTDSNVYHGTFSIIGQPETRMEYKFDCFWSIGWGAGLSITEEPLSTGGANRAFTLLPTNGTLVLPVVPFGDVKPSDLLPEDTQVVFSVDMAGAVGLDGHAFDPRTDRVYLNGDFLTWTPWCYSGGRGYKGWSAWDLCSGLLPLTNAPGSQVYSRTLQLGERVALRYRYSINGQDNEPPGGQNHVRYVRRTGDYTLPLDKFGAPVQEPSFGNLKAALSDPQHVLISWLGRPGVRLQSCVNPATESWEDHPETDGLSATNWPTAEGGKLFRLVKP